MRTAKDMVAKLTPDQAWHLAARLDLTGEPYACLNRLADWLPNPLIRRLVLGVDTSKEEA